MFVTKKQANFIPDDKGNNLNIYYVVKCDMRVWFLLVDLDCIKGD